MGQNEGRSLSLKVEVLDMRYVAPFGSDNASKATGVKNHCQISNLLISCKI